MPDVQELPKERNDIASEISNLKKQLNHYNEKKEFWFKKKEDLKQDIKNLIQQVKEIKLKTDSSNISVQDMKKERDKYNDHVSHLIEEITELNKKKKEIFEKYKIKEDPYKVQKNIEAIEKKLETETSFENEKKLMKRLNALKSIYKESKIKELIERIDKLNKELKDSKKKSQEFHMKVLSTASDKNGYASFIDLSRKINNLRTEQEQAFNNFIDNKKKFIEFNNLLKDKLKASSLERASIQKSRHVSEERTRERIKQILREKTQNVIEKFRKKKKLTTEDLIVLQGEDKS
ncbi:MAG: hypothetical protein KJ623_01580 [Nanoarchaeota archaeon]|nr:hypothetical protein [Nanoarchaeota archaeon]MBU0962755.1 hypothetical protein [Nanoarchaeota archaeon]